MNAHPISTKPYFIRALYEWCTDNSYTPYILVKVQKNVHVPMEFVKNGEIVLNISFVATGELKIDNDAITFKAGFGERICDIYVPISTVAAIYASENHQGMMFDVPPESDEVVSLEKSYASSKPAISLAVSNTENVEENSALKEDSAQKKLGKDIKKPSLTIIK